MENIRSPLSKVLAVLLWAATLMGGLLDIYVFQFISISFYARFFLSSAARVNPTDVATSNTIRIVTVLIMAVLYVIFLIATSEYHFRHLAEPRSWRLLGQTIAVELLIIAVAYIMGPVTW